MKLLEPDRNQIERFFDAVFRNCGNQGFISFRSFTHDNKPFNHEGVPVTSGFKYLVDVAEDHARRAANEPEQMVFCPPVAIFDDKKLADLDHLLVGLVLAVDHDQWPKKSCARLEEVLGPATATIRSGGKWKGPDGQEEDKLHTYRRLARGARGADELAKLSRVQKLAAQLVDGDASITIVHPLRWPGSWHRKDEPRLCEIESLDPDREIDLDAALAALEAAVPNANGFDRAGQHHHGDDGGDGRERADWVALTANILAGKDLHDSTMRLAASYVASGMKPEHALRQLQALMLASPPPHDERWKSRFDDIGRLLRDAGAKFGGDQRSEESEKAAAPKSGTPWIWEGETRIEEARKWLVANLLPETGVALIAGQWGTFKTFLALDLAVAVMTGGTFIKYAVMRRGGVLLFACEGQNEVAIRIRAAYEARGGEGKAPFAWQETSPRLLDAGAAAELVALIREAAEKMQRDFGLPVALVIIDTASKAAGYSKAGEENDAALAKVIMRTLSHVSTATGALMVPVAHFGKHVETGTRGSSVYEDDADVVLAALAEREINGTVSNTRLSARKRKSGPTGEEYSFGTKSSDMGFDLAGIALNTLTIKWIDAAATNAKTKPDPWRKKSLRLLRQALMSVLADQGRETRPWANGPSVRAVDIEIIRGEFYRGYPAAEAADTKGKQAARRQAFNRGITDAKAANLIGAWEVEGITWIWLIDPTPSPQSTAAKGFTSEQIAETDAHEILHKPATQENGPPNDNWRKAITDLGDCINMQCFQCGESDSDEKGKVKRLKLTGEIGGKARPLHFTAECAKRNFRLE